MLVYYSIDRQARLLKILQMNAIERLAAIAAAFASSGDDIAIAHGFRTVVSGFRETALRGDISQQIR